jgi:catechol O-methyltransferase
MQVPERFRTKDDGKEEKLLDYVLQNAVDNEASSVLKCIDDFGWNQHWMMCLGDEKGEFLDEAIKLVNPQPCNMVLEIGLYCGYSSTRIASQLPEDAKVYTIEPNEKYRSIATQIHKKAGVQHKIEILPGTAAEVIPSLKDRGLKFDFVFIDHEKSFYYDDLKLVEQHGLMREGTVVAADNVVIFDLKEYINHVRNSGKYKSSILRRGHVEYSKDREDGVEISVFAG